VPTAAELQIVLTAQDRASAQLQAVGQDVARLERQVESSSGAFGRLRGVIGGLGQLGLAGQGLRTIIDGARSQPAMHSTSTSVNLPSFVVSSRPMPRRLRQCSTSASAPSR